MEDGEIPLWNPYLFAGAPFLATGQHSAYYPFGVLFLVVPLAKAYGWFTLSQLWLAGVLGYVFGRILGMRRVSAAIVGLVYQGCGFMVVSAAVFPMIIAGAAWLPLLLGGVEMVIRPYFSMSAMPENGRFSSPVLWFGIGVLALGSQILAGHIEITYYTLLIMALYAAWRLVWLFIHARRWRTVWQPAVWLGGMVALGLMLGAIQLVPLYEVGQVNFREGSASFAEVRGYAFPVRRLVTLLVPNFFGNPSHHTYTDVLSGEQVIFDRNYYGQPNPRGAGTSDWGIKNYVEGAIYLGILPLFLAVLGVVGGWKQRGKRPFTLFFLILNFFSLAFIFGTPLYALLYYGLPFINQLHTPFRWVFPLSLGVAVLAGQGMDWLAESPPIGGEGWRNWWVVRWICLGKRPSFISGLAAITFWGGILLLAGLLFSRLIYGRIEPQIEQLFLGMALAPDAFPHARAFYSYEFRQIFLFALMLIGTGAVLRVSYCPIYFRHRPIYLYMAALLITTDLFLAHVGFNAAVDPALLDYQPQLIQWLKQQPGHWRLTTFNPHGDKPLNANTPWLFDLQDVRGYDSIIPRQYTQFMSVIEPQNELPFNRVQPVARLESLNSPLLSVLGVKYVITAETINLPQYRQVWEGEGLRVYENLDVAPRAYLLPQSSTAVSANVLADLTRYDPRQYVLVETADWPHTSSTTPVPGQLQPATIDEYRRIQVTISAQTSEPAWLILNDSYFPGWKAFIRPFGSSENEETQVPLYRVNGNFRGIELQPGHWTIRFRYSPATFQLGGLLSFMAGVILLFTAGIWGWQRLIPANVTMTTTRSLAKNSVAPMVLNLFNKLIDFAFAAFYLRFLGPADAGSYAYAIATAGFFDIISNFGLNILLIRDVSQAREQASRYLLNTSILRLGTGLIGALPVLAYVAASRLGSNPPTTAETTAIILIMVGMVFSGMAQGVTGLFYVHEQAEVPAAMTTATTILKVGFGVAALLMGYGFVGLAGVSILVNIITLGVLTWLAFRRFSLPGPWQVDWGLQREMVRKGFPLMLIHLLQTVFISIDVVILRTMLSNGQEVVGWYNSAYKWFNALQIVPSFFTLALFPVISREIQRSVEAARRMYQMGLKLMLLLALPVAALTTFAAYPLVRLLGGVEFLPHGAIALQIVIWSIPIGWLNSVTNYVLIALGLERMQPRAFAVAVVFNIVTNVLFVPRYTYVAASVTTILSELVLLVLFEYYLRRKMPGLNWWQFVARPFLVTAVTILVMFLGAQVHLLLGLALGILVYPLGLWVLRVFGAEERRVLQAILPSRVAARLGLG
ncbi:MAG: hypothetical protein D6706_15110 [Chloroflexi bacterium]|nr:MAG: hypothetical protein D6706_15110 [Chloroflexota bacterium]